MARNHLARPVLVCSKIVPASKECCLRQATHSWTILVFSAYASPWPHTAHRNPPGQRALNRYSRHCSSVPNWARNDGMSSGRSSGSIVVPPPIADGRHHSRSMLQINLMRSVPDRQLSNICNDKARLLYSLHYWRYNRITGYVIEGPW